MTRVKSKSSRTNPSVKQEESVTGEKSPHDSHSRRPKPTKKTKSNRAKVSFKHKLALSEKNVSNESTCALTEVKRGRSKKTVSPKDAEILDNVLESDSENVQNEQPEVMKHKGEKRKKAQRVNDIKKLKISNKFNVRSVQQGRSQKNHDPKTMLTDLKSKLKIKLKLEPSKKGGNKKNSGKLRNKDGKKTTQVGEKDVQVDLQDNVVNYEVDIDIANNAKPDPEADEHVLSKSVTDQSKEKVMVDIKSEIVIRRDAKKVNILEADINIAKDSSSSKSLILKTKIPRRRSENTKYVQTTIRNQKLKANSSASQYNINENDDISCRICEQKLDQTKLHTGDLDEGLKKERALLNPGLSLFTRDGKNTSSEDMRAYNKITSFT